MSHIGHTGSDREAIEYHDNYGYWPWQLQEKEEPVKKKKKKKK